jgi:hypothetical protein
MPWFFVGAALFGTDGPDLGSAQLRRGFCYAASAETVCALRRIDFPLRLLRLFDRLKSRAIAGGTSNLDHHFTPSFHRDQSLKSKRDFN